MAWYPGGNTPGGTGYSWTFTLLLSSHQASQAVVSASDTAFSLQKENAYIFKFSTGRYRYRFKPSGILPDPYLDLVQRQVPVPNLVKATEPVVWIRIKIIRIHIRIRTGTFLSNLPIFKHRRKSYLKFQQGEKNAGSGSA